MITKNFNLYNRYLFANINSGVANYVLPYKVSAYSWDSSSSKYVITEYDFYSDTSALSTFFTTSIYVSGTYDAPGGGGGQYSLWVGEDSTPLSLDTPDSIICNDVTLKAPISSSDLDLISFNITKGIDSDESISLLFTRTFKAKRDMSIKELGLSKQQRLSYSVTSNLLMDRTLLNTPKEVKSGEYFTVSLGIKF